MGPSQRRSTGVTEACDLVLLTIKSLVLLISQCGTCKNQSGSGGKGGRFKVDRGPGTV